MNQFLDRILPENSVFRNTKWNEYCNMYMYNKRSRIYYTIDLIYKTPAVLVHEFSHFITCYLTLTPFVITTFKVLEIDGKSVSIIHWGAWFETKNKLFSIAIALAPGLGLYLFYMFIIALAPYNLLLATILLVYFISTIKVFIPSDVDMQTAIDSYFVIKRYLRCKYLR